MKNCVFYDFDDLDVIDFLRESNAIEGVYDLESLGNALVAWGHLSKVKTLETIDVLTVHSLLMKNHLYGKDLGYYRGGYVSVAGRLCVPPDYIAESMSDWLERIKSGRLTSELNKQAHIEFERIHPFIDGNGRVGRMIYLWQAIRDQIPFKFMKEANKSEYYDWFEV